MSYAVVEDAGRDLEQVVEQFADFMDAADYVDEEYTTYEKEDLNVDIMRIRDDGSLTTEF